MNRRGAALILSYMVVAVLTILSSSFIASSFTERNLVQRHVDSIDAFWLAEAGINRALNELRVDNNISGEGIFYESLSPGFYSVDIEILGPLSKIVSHGSVPADGPVRVERTIEALASRGFPADFFDYGIYSAGDITLNGNSFIINGNVLYAGDLYAAHPGNINGETTNDPTASPLPYLDFPELRIISEAQGNIYDADRLWEVKNGTDSFPGSFWYSEPSDPETPDGIPNVVYIESDLQLSGDIGIIGGFYVVVGDVLTNPLDVEDLTINGSGEIYGVIYTRGEFIVNGGAGGLNIWGGVWAGQEIRLNGNCNITYNPYYMQAIQNLDIEPDVEIVSWRDTQNPFHLSE